MVIVCDVGHSVDRTFLLQCVGHIYVVFQQFLLDLRFPECTVAETVITNACQSTFHSPHDISLSQFFTYSILYTIETSETLLEI